MSVKAYVLIVTDPGRTKEAYESVREVPGVSEVHEVMGPYDIVAEVEGESLAEISAILGQHIRRVEGVQSTVSLVTFPD